jgi:hypothetical protein
MNIRSALALFAGPILFSLPANACLNDRDSDALAIQAKKLPDVVRVITGRFERNPPLYYQMRVDRVKAELQKNPRQWGLYDDIAVALDRLHRDDEALKWIEKKRSILPPYNRTNLPLKEAWYRYYANVGTFRVHRWLKNGAKKQTSSELVQAQSEIRHATQIKPNAHFGRETYQLMAMEWLYAVKHDGSTDTLDQYLAGADGWEDSYQQPSSALPHRKAAIEGLSGLIVLGAAWESPDVFRALSYALDQRDSAGLSVLALLRCNELLHAGKRSLTPGQNDESFNDLLVHTPTVFGWRYGVTDANAATLHELYPKLRDEAEQWSSKRTAFMEERLRAGRHPDTDLTFWSGYEESAAPDLDIRWTTFEEQRHHGVNWYAVDVYAAGALAIGLILWRLARKIQEDLSLWRQRHG